VAADTPASRAMSFIVAKLLHAFLVNKFTKTSLLSYHHFSVLSSGLFKALTNGCFAESNGF
jgi:hypothetical protein